MCSLPFQSRFECLNINFWRDFSHKGQTLSFGHTPLEKRLVGTEYAAALAAYPARLNPAPCVLNYPLKCGRP